MYQIGWVLLKIAPSGLDLEVVQRARVPLLSPAQVGGWALGSAPALCKQPNIVFVEGAETLGGDRFRLYYGAADATEGSAKVAVHISGAELGL